MKFSKRALSIVLIVFVFVNSCGPTPTPTPTPPYPNVPVPIPYVPPSNLPELTTPSPLPFPDMYFVIDESGSMTGDDSAGKSCDPDKLRYKIPLFMASILKELSDQDVANVPKIHLLLKDEQQYLQIRNPISPAQAVVKLGDRYSSPQSSYIQPFDAGKNPDALEFVLSTAKENDYIFLFTDGDFRKDRYRDDPYDQNASDTANKVDGLFENKDENINTFIFLLCTRRIESANNRFMKKTWENIDYRKQAVMYGYDLDDFSKKENLSVAISSMLSDWLGSWDKDEKNGYLTSGWGWYDAKDLPPVRNLNPGLVRLRYGAISFDNLPVPPNQQSTMQILLDGKIPPIDNKFFGYVNDFIPPEKRCGPHLLEFDKTTLDEYTFYWWWADIPELFAEASSPLILYNDDEIKNYFFDVRAGSSLVKEEFLKSGDLDNYFRCFEELWINLGDKAFPLEYQTDDQMNDQTEGKLLLKNISNSFRDMDQPLPNGNGSVPLKVQGAWRTDGEKWLFFAPIQILSEKNAKIRYYPVIGNNAPLSTTPTPTQESSQEIKLQIIPLDFLDAKFYPSEFLPESWLPTVQFDGNENDCPPGLTTPVQPPYLPPSGGQYPSFNVQTIQVGESGLEITSDKYSNDDLKKCNKLILSWDKWPRSIEDWQAPPKIELVCSFDGFESIFGCK